MPDETKQDPTAPTPSPSSASAAPPQQLNLSEVFQTLGVKEFALQQALGQVQQLVERLQAVEAQNLALRAEIKVRSERDAKRSRKPAL